jgi:hypothetical protein
MEKITRKPRRKWIDRIEMDCKEMECEDVRWHQLAYL